MVALPPNFSPNLPKWAYLQASQCIDSPFNINTLSNKLVKDYSTQYNASERANSREYVNCLLTKNFNQITNISLKSDKIYWNINFQVFTRAFFYTTIKWVEHKSYMALVGWIYMAVLGSVIFNLTSTSVIYNCKVVFRL